MHSARLLTLFCELLTTVAILCGRREGGTCLKFLNGTTPLWITASYPQQCAESDRRTFWLGHGWKRLSDVRSSDRTGQGRLEPFSSGKLFRQKWNVSRDGRWLLSLYTRLKRFNSDRPNLNCSLLAYERIDCRLACLWIKAFPYLAPFSTVACHPT